MTIDQPEQSAQQHQGIIDWVSTNMGARVTEIRRQRRWRRCGASMPKRMELQYRCYSRERAPGTIFPFPLRTNTG